MPRPTKNITPGSLTDPVPAARSRVWRKHAGPEHSSQYEPDGTILVDAMTHETVAEIDLTDVESPVIEVKETTSLDVVEPEPVVTRVWVTERTIEGRTYRRSDSLVPEDA